MNPTYVGELRALDEPRARGFTGADILDVLGIEVDGVDIAAGVGEARVLVAVDELARALLSIGEGAPAAQATIGPGPTELVVEARGPDLLLSLVSLGPRAQLLAGGLIVDAQKMRASTLHAARGLLLDLLAISPLLGDAPLSRRLAESAAELSRRPARSAPRWPAQEAAAKALVVHAGRGGASMQLQLPPEATARLRSWAAVKLAPLAPHLAQGSLALVRRGAPGIACQGVLLLFLRNLLGDAERLIEAWEGGAREFALQFGPHELHCDLTRDEVRAAGWRRPAALAAVQLAKLISLSALAYGKNAHKSDELARDLREQARALDRHCQDLESGDLRRAPQAVATPKTTAQASPERGPLSQGRMRRLVYREAWRAPAPEALRALPFASGAVLVEQPGALAARDGHTGEQLWKVDAAPGAVARGLDVFYAEPGDALVRLDVAAGEPRWKRRLRGAAHPARLWTLPSGVARSLPGEGLAVVNDAGALTVRAQLPGGAPSDLVAVDQVLVCALSPGSLAAVDPADGRLLWKRRCKAQALLACGARALVLEEGALSCVDPHDGSPVWEREVPPGAASLVLGEGTALLLAGGAVLSFSLTDGAPKNGQPLPWARHLAVSDDQDFVVATGDGGEARRLDGKRWSLAPQSGAPSAPAQIGRNVVLLQRSQPSLFDATDGLILAQLPPARAAILCPDLSCVLLSESDLAVHRLTTHLSVL